MGQGGRLHRQGHPGRGRRGHGQGEARNRRSKGQRRRGRAAEGGGDGDGKGGLQPGQGDARGRWYLQDRVIVPEHKFMLFGAAFYIDRYRKTSDGWKICGTGYQRTYEVAQTLDANTKVTPGPALA